MALPLSPVPYEYATLWLPAVSVTRIVAVAQASQLSVAGSVTCCGLPPSTARETVRAVEVPSA